jgi:hypothetical protein
MADNIMELSIYAEIIKLRYPRYEIAGGGPLAVVQHCSSKVTLCLIPLEARVVKARRCGADCSHTAAPDGRFHVIEVLEQPRPPYQRTFRRNPADMERD